jgi:phage major head subunit gpT-like protein
MGITNQSFVDAASTTFHAKFDELFEKGTPGFFRYFTEVIPTKSKVNEIDLLEAMPVIREWLGAKEFISIRASKLSATVKKYEKSFEIDRLDVQADQTGLTGRRIAAFLNSDGGQVYDKIVSDALVSNSGDGPVGYDGVNLISTAHPRGPSGNQSNKSTTALSFGQHDSIMQAGMGLRDERGEPFGISYDVMMVGPKNMRLGMEITQSSERIIGIAGDGSLDSGTRVAATTIPNVWGPGTQVYGGGPMTLLVNPRLVGTQDDYYYYFDTKKGAMPIVLFEFRSPEAIEQMQMDSEARFLLDKFRASVECDVVATAGAWQTVYAGIL